MNRDELKDLWRKTLAEPTIVGLKELARSVAVLCDSDSGFRQHIANRSERVTSRTGIAIDPNQFNIESARAFIVDEIGSTSWNDLVSAVKDPDNIPLLFRYAIAAMDRGDFTALEEAIGPENFHDRVAEWFENGLFKNEQETLNEIFSASCMLGQTQTAAFLLDKGVDPYGGMKTGLSGFHYAASSGRLDVIKLLIERCVPMEVKNIYGGTVFGQAIWSAVNEYTPQHGEIVERLIEAGAVVDGGYREWWDEQNVPDPSTKERIANALARHAEFHKRIADAKQNVSDAEDRDDKRTLADSLKALGSILRRPRFLRDEANSVYERAANLYKEIGLPLEAAWVLRHIGINHEYADRLDDAEKYYDESLALFRRYASDDDNNYANTVRYPAVIKNRRGKHEESRALWEGKVCREGV
jgi:tetratricopeptide (TPR) repeat protein